jgi:hypothetical protein
MRYIRVHWHHSHSDEPVELLSELDDRDWETRKVEVFRDGRIGYASASESIGSTELGLAPVPSVEEIARDPQFLPEEISREEFDQVWDAAHRAARVGRAS